MRPVALWSKLPDTQMVASEQILSYIEENTKAGYSRIDIEVALRAAGWAELDVADAFVAFANKGATPTAPRAVSAAQLATNAEIARIQEELRHVVVTPTQAANPIEPEKGLTGLLIRTNLASTKRGARLTIVISTICVCAVVYWFFLR